MKNLKKCVVSKISARYEHHGRTKKCIIWCPKRYHHETIFLVVQAANIISAIAHHLKINIDLHINYCWLVHSLSVTCSQNAAQSHAVKMLLKDNAYDVPLAKRYRRQYFLLFKGNRAHLKGLKSHICTFLQIYFGYSNETW